MEQRFLWGADVVTIGRGRPFSPATTPITETDEVEGGVRPGNSDWYALEVDSRTAVATVNELVGAGVVARLATEQFETRQGDMPAGSVLFRVQREGSAPRRRARGRAVVRARAGSPARP